MKKFLLSLAILLLAKHVSSSVNNEGSRTIDVLNRMLQQTEETKENFKEILEEKSKIEVHLLEDLDNQVEFELASHPTIIQAHDALATSQGKNIDECQNVYQSKMKEIVVEIHPAIMELVKENLRDIDVAINELGKDLEDVKQTIINELQRPEADSAVCENNNENCKTLNGLGDRTELLFNTADKLKTLTSVLIKKPSLYLSKEEATTKLQNYVLGPVNECLKKVL